MIDDLDTIDKLRDTIAGLYVQGEQLAGRCEALEAERDALLEENKALKAAWLAVADLIDESEGVAGLHKNGDTATWGELSTGGRFEDWLLAFDEAAKFIDREAAKGTA